MAKLRKFYDLDNAAKIFPAVSHVNRSYMFRISAILREDIDADSLTCALVRTTKRFVNFNVRLKKGVFWHYFEENPKKPKVIQETIFINKLLITKENNDFLFRTLYYEKRLTVEFFHALTDGVGALEFFNSLLYEYLSELGHQINAEGKIKTTEVEFRYDEISDQFQSVYDKNKKVNRKEPHAYHLKATQYTAGYLAVMHANMQLDQVKKASKSYGATITEFMSAAIIYATLKADKKNTVYKKLYRMIIPVNMRKYFSLDTLRNFASFVRINYDLNQKDVTFKEVIDIVKIQMKQELILESMHERIVSNVRFEKNIFNRITPLFLKVWAMRIVYGLIGESMNSFALSNLGRVDLPESMRPHVSHYQFIIGASPSVVKSASMISYENHLVLTFVSCVIERHIERAFFDILTKEGIDVTLEANEWEVLS